MLEEGADQSFGARFRLRIAIIARRDDDGRQRLLCNRRATICLIRLGAGQVFRGFVQLRNFAYSCTAQHCSQLIEQQIAIARVGLLGRHLSGRHLDRRRDFQCNEKRGAGFRIRRGQGMIGQPKFWYGGMLQSGAAGRFFGYGGMRQPVRLLR